jgi:hypothetical protein
MSMAVPSGVSGAGRAMQSRARPDATSSSSRVKDRSSICFEGCVFVLCVSVGGRRKKKNSLVAVFFFLS